MMERWNVVPTDDPLEPYLLCNTTQTAITYSRTTRFDVSDLLCAMEERGVPLGFTRGLREIRFTRMRDYGTYLNGVLKLDVGRYVGSSVHVCQTFVHEIGHHVDELEAISDDPRVIREKRHGWRHLPDPYAEKNVGEYVGVGFETFYYGKPDERREMRERCRFLHLRIAQAHRKYRER